MMDTLKTCTGTLEWILDSLGGEHALDYEIVQEIKRNIEESNKVIKESENTISFDQCLSEEFLINTQNFPREYHSLFWNKYKRAEARYEEQFSKKPEWIVISVSENAKRIFKEAVEGFISKWKKARFTSSRKREIFTKEFVEENAQFVRDQILNDLKKLLK